MAEYIDREAARDLMYHKQDALTEYDLNSIPASDVVPVVRCRDCKNFKTKYCAVDVWHEDITIFKATENDFCSFGKRRCDDDGNAD